MTKICLNLSECHGLGDTIASTPVIRKLHESYQQKISVFTKHPVIFKGNPYVDTIIDSNNTSMESIKHEYTFLTSFRTSTHNDEVAMKHNMMDIRQFHATNLGFNLSKDEMKMDFYPDEYNPIENLPDKYVLIHAAQTWPSRTWDKDKWQELINRLEKINIPVVIVGKDSSEVGFFNIDKPIIDLEIKLGLNLTNKTNLSQTWWLIEKSMCFVTMDSGLLHLAGTTNAKILQLGSSIKKEFRAPYRHGSQDYNYEYISGPCQIYCASNMKYGVKEWGTIMGVPPLIGCLENKPTFECHPSVDQVFNSIVSIVSTKNTSLKLDKAYILLSSDKYYDITTKCTESIRENSSIPIIVYMINSDKKIKTSNTITINWDVKLSENNSNDLYSNDNDKNFYINRKNKTIYEILIQKPLITKHALEIANTVCFVDSDSIATKYVDTIFNYYKNDTYPYFVEGVYDFMIMDGKGYPSDNSFSSTLEHPACQFFNADQNNRRTYRQTGYYVAGQNTMDFLNEWYSMCSNETILNNNSYFAPFNEETIVNVLLWKLNLQNGLPYIYCNGSLQTIDEIKSIGFGVNPNYVREWFKIPQKEEHLLFIHGEKRPEIMEKMKNTVNTIFDDKRINVLILAPHLSTGGMPAFVLKRVETILEHSKDINLFVVEYSQYSPTYTVQRNKIQSLLPNKFWSLGYYGEDDSLKQKLIDILYDNKIDIVHIEDNVEGFDSFNKMPESLIKSLYSKTVPWRVVETCHNIWFNPRIMKAYHPDGYAFCTPFHEKYTFNDQPELKTTIQFPIQDKIPTKEQKEIIKEKLNFDKNKINILNVGLWTSGKNQGESLEIARSIEHTHPNIHFHFVGNQAPNFQEYWGPLMESLPSNVTIWGEKENVDEYMIASDIFIFNSTYECNPIVLKEAISYGLPIISRNLSQYLDIYKDKIIEIPQHFTTNDITNLLIETTTKGIDSIKLQLPKIKDETKDFVKSHEKFYSEVMTTKREIKKLSDINIIQHFVDQPFIEIKGDSDSIFKVRVYDENNNLHYNNDIKSYHWIRLNRRYYTKWRTKIYENDELIYDKVLNLENKRVLINFESSSLGDTIAWLPYCLEFKQKHNCHVIVSTFKNFLFKNSYPELEFVEPGSTVRNIYASYHIGWFYDSNREPVLPNTIPLQKTATNILGLEFKEIKPKIDFIPGKRLIKEKYVTIATNSTAGCKLWTIEGWQSLVDYLVNLGYKVINVSKEDNPLKGVSKIKDTSLEYTMNIIHHSEFFIGLSSGLSWLSWALNKHVIMISNFTDIDHEFISDCTRIYNKSVCNSCWNNPNFKFDKGDWNWCPINKNTSKQFECHKSITAEMVINQLKNLIK